MGDSRIAHRDLQIKRSRPAGLDDRRAHKTRQPLARLEDRRANALGLRKKADLSHCRSGAAAPLNVHRRSGPPPRLA